MPRSCPTTAGGCRLAKQTAAGRKEVCPAEVSPRQNWRKIQLCREAPFVVVEPPCRKECAANARNPRTEITLVFRECLDELVDFALGGVEVRARAEAAGANHDGNAVLGLEMALDLVVVVQV